MKKTFFHLVLLLGLLSVARVLAAPATTAEAIREGDTLRRTQRYEEAREVYENWLKLHADDARVTFELGYSLYLQAGAEGASQHGTDLRKRSYQLVRESERLGFSDAMLDLMKRAIDADGRDLTQFSTSPAIEALMREGEQAFAAGKFDDALKAYQKALALDPTSYSAALFIGDVYFNRNEYATALVWFDKAVGIDPNRETAHRYWGDALVKLGRIDEALDQYLLAVVAEPYNRLPRQMLQVFATKIGRPLRPSPLGLPNLAVGTAGGQITVNQDVQNDPLLILYVKARATWQRQEWPKHFGAESTVRHSLPEETDSLRAIAVLTGAAPTADREKFKPWADTLAAIQTLSNAGLLEACVLLEHADDGVILDYAAYREQNRPLLLRYLREYALGPVPAASAPSK